MLSKAAYRANMGALYFYNRITKTTKRKELKMPADYFNNMTDEQARAELARMGIACPKSSK